ncbi:hypothetical protein [Methylobacterium marchantiae]|uniref:Uncharacterized protein n=1 Tax=Methylobacterium marchantiae TaxID=600331 RepID=A0ABW3WZN9_9HYPH|nr:hypothetical protein AIGOOFII_1047 [Methylobacterium marchantiae]
MKQILLASLLLGSLTAPLAAQPAPDAPPPPDTKEERQKNTAAKLAGLLQFVSESCTDSKPNYETFKQVVRGLGIEPDALAGGELILRVKAYADVYSQDVPANCAKALANFGENGTTLPGLVVKK